MKTFSENLRAFSEKEGLPNNEILVLTDLKPRELKLLEDGEFDVTAMRKFCLGLGISFSSLYSDNGFQYESVIQQYRELNKEYRVSASYNMCKELSEAIGEQLLVTKMREWSIDQAKYALGLVKGTSYFSEESLTQLRKCFSTMGMIDEITFDSMLLKHVIDRILTFNSFAIFSTLGLSKYDVAKKLDLTRSNVHNWGVLHGTPVPFKYAEAIAGLTEGAFTEYELVTILMNKTTVVSRLTKSLNIASSIKPKYSRSNTNTPRSESDNNRVGNKKLEASDIQIAPKFEVNKQGSDIASLLEEKSAKMFSKLSESNKKRVHDLILELFLSQL